jgi:formylglycine-generating enzyme required for sulfatase activity
MAKKNKAILGMILFTFMFILGLATLLASASFYIYSSKLDFDQGTYNETYYNETNNAVQLNLSFNNGTYTSQIFDTGSNVSLNNLTWEYQRIQCPEGMAYINKLNGFCIDKYEAVAMNSDGTWNESSGDNGWVNEDTISLLNAGGYAGSEEGHYPWVFISQEEARTACENAGKYLCTDEEWLAAANYQGEYFNLPTTISNCTVSSNCVLGNDLGPNGGDACYGGAMVNCVSSEGVYDMTGNVHELTNETIEYTKPCEPVGISGFCYWNGTTFLNITNAQTAVFGNDGVHFTGGTPTNKAVIRGGFWGYGTDAGPFCAFLHRGSTYTTSSVGFRCCSS